MDRISLFYVKIPVLLCIFIPRVVFCGFTTTKIGPQPLWNATHADKLKQDILLNYDKFARPAQHYNKTTVYFGIALRHVDINEHKHTLTVNCWLRLKWTDEKLKWNTSDYGGLQTINLAEHEIWQPDIFVYNSATSTSINQYGNCHCIVYPTGEVLWVPPAQLTVLCTLNLKYWPYDTQKCQLKFGSWTYNGDQIDLLLFDNITKPNLELVIESSEWKIDNILQEKLFKFYDCCTEAYVEINVNLTLSRISPAYKSLVLSPLTVIIMLMLLVFWLPPTSGEKILLNAATALLICLFLFYFTQKIPAMGTHVPNIVLFYCSCLYIVVFSTIESVFVIHLSTTNHVRALPWMIKQPLTGTFGRFLLLDGYMNQSTISSQRVTAEEMRDHQVDHASEEGNGPTDQHHFIRTTYSANSKTSIQQDWILLAAAVDRVSFIFFSFLVFILQFVYSTKN